LKDEKNSELREKIILGHISPKELSTIDESVILIENRNWQVVKRVNRYRRKSSSLGS
jgi:hypothetical protein